MEVNARRLLIFEDPVALTQVFAILTPFEARSFHLHFVRLQVEKADINVELLQKRVNISVLFK